MADITVDLWQDFDFTTLDTTNLGTNDHATGGTWTITDPNSRLSTSTSAEKISTGLISGNSDSGGTRGLRYDSPADFNAGVVAYEYASTHTTISFGFWFRFPAEYVGTFEGGQPDILYVENALGTNELYVKLTDNNQGQLILFTAEAGGSTTIDVEPDTWYWITAKYSTTHSLRVYDVDGTQVGAEKTRTGSAQASTIASLGNLIGDEGGGGPFDYDDWVMDWTSATFPLGPPLATGTVDQEGFRWGTDNANEASHGFEAAQDTDITILDDQSRLLRALLNGTDDPGALAYTLRVQKNGSGGYTAVPVGASTNTSPPTAPSATVTTIGAAADPWTINRPAASTGDLIVFVIAWDDSVTVTSVAAPAGVNSETAVSIAGPIASSGTEMRAQAWYYLATGAWSTGTLSFNPSAAETCRAVAFVIPTGQFNASDPIGFANTRASAGTAETSVLSPTGTAESTDGDGRLYIGFGSDADALTAPGSNWNTINNATGGGVGLLVGSRNALVSNSESITALTATIASDSWATLCFVVKPQVVANEVYVTTSANIAAGGEATTARLTAPSGKTTSDFTTGRRWDDENGADSIDIATDFYTEVEWLVYIAATAINGDFYDFRVYSAAAALDTYSVTPRWTIGTSGLTVSAATEALTLTRQNASIARSRALSAATEVLTLTRHNATVARSRAVAAATEVLTLTAQPSSLARSRGILAATAALTLTGQVATVTFETSNDREVAAATELLTLTGQAASIITDRGVLASAEALTLTSFAATVQRGEIVTTAISRRLQSTRYVPSKSPLNTDPVLRSYTEREFQAIARSLSVSTTAWLDVRNFGAVEGEDSTAALQEAIDSTPEGFALFVAGDYLTDELTLDSWSNRTLLGPGSLTLIPGASSTAVVLRITGTGTNVTIDGLTLIGTNTSGNSEVAITAEQAATLTNIKVKNCTIRDINAGVYAAGYAGGGLYGAWRITNNYFDNIVGTASGTGLGVVAENPLALIVAHNHFRRTQRHACYHGLGSNSLGYMEVVNNTFELHRNGVSTGGQVPAVTFGRGAYGKCSGNIFRDCEDGSVDAFFDTALSKDFTGLQITDNFFINRQNAVPDVTIGQAEDPGSYRTYDVQINGNLFMADQDDAGTTQFVYIYNGSRGSVCNNHFQVKDAGSSQYLVRLGDASVISSDADCEDWLIADNVAYVQGAAAATCKLLHVAADICTNTSRHHIYRNELFGPGYTDYGAAVTNANLLTDAP